MSTLAGGWLACHAGRVKRRVGLTGGIGSGKSSVARLLADRGAVVIDYDQVAREVVEPGAPALAAIAQRFGSGVLAADGHLDRAALAAVVFADESARRELERITHPAIRARAAQLHADAPAGSVVVHENPLLVEMGGHSDCDLVVVVDAPVEERVVRLVERGMDEADARARIAAQLDATVRNAVADVVIDNSGAHVDLQAVVDDLWAQLHRA